MPLIMGINNNDNRKFLALCGLIILLCILACSSCMVDRKGRLTEKGINFIAQHCKGDDSSATYDKTVIKWDTLMVPYPVEGETIFIENPCDSLGRLKPINKKGRKNGINTSVRSIGGTLAVDCNTDSLRLVIQEKERTIRDFKSTKVVIQKPCEQEHISGTQWMFIRLGQILSGFLLLQTLLRFLSIYPPLKWLKLFYVFKF